MTIEHRLLTELADLSAKRIEHCKVYCRKGRCCRDIPCDTYTRLLRKENAIKAVINAPYPGLTATL